MRTETKELAGGGAILLVVLALASAAAAPAAAQETAEPSLEARNTELARRFTDEIYNQRLLDEIPKYVAEDFVDRSPGLPPEARGPAFVRQQAEASFRSFPELAFVVEETVAEGDLVALRWSARGTASAEVAGAVAAGRPIELEGMSIFRFRDGLIVESWDLVDRQGLLTQLGFRMVPPSTPPPAEAPPAVPQVPEPPAPGP